MTTRMTMRIDVLDLLAYYNIDIVLRGEEAAFACPFHNDRDPSANANLVIAKWTCHRCKIGGSMIDFVSRLENWPYKKAERWIRDRYGGFYKPASLLKEVEMILKKAENRVYSEKILDKYRFYHKYWANRGVSKQTAEKWNLGYDARTQRVTIPIRRFDGKLVGVQGRTVLKNEDNKYTFIHNFSKKRHLHGLHLIDHGDWVVVVESVMNAIRISEMDIPTVSVMGSVVSEEQAQLLDSFNKVYMLLDNDEAGWVGMLGPTESPEKFRRSKVAAWKKIHSKVYIPSTEDYDDVDNLDKEQILDIINTSKNAQIMVPLSMSKVFAA